MAQGLRLYNSLTRRREDFTPIDVACVRMYVCGPTVYDYAHIGNARPVIVFDLLYRLLRYLYGAAQVVYARNITDVTPDEVRHVMQVNGVQTLIHGHTHRPATHLLQINHQPARRIVLGDWDKQGWFLQVDQNGFVQHAFDLPVN